MDEKGIIKFKLKRVKAPPFGEDQIGVLNDFRRRTHRLGLIGVYPTTGVGYGNISEKSRENPSQFIISGSQTGGLQTLTGQHYVLVTDYNFDDNSLECLGPIDASSESLSHAAVYKSDKRIMGIIHAHNRKMWDSLMDLVPTTSKKVEYGTPAMAQEILRLFRETDVAKRGIFVMGGHEDGIVAFGTNLAEAFRTLTKYFKK